MGYRDVRCLPPYMHMHMCMCMHMYMCVTCVYIWQLYILCPLINTPTQGVIISQPKTSFLGVVFDVYHDFEGPRAPKAHLDTVNTNLLDHLAPPP